MNFLEPSQKGDQLTKLTISMGLFSMSRQPPFPPGGVIASRLLARLGRLVLLLLMSEHIWFPAKALVAIGVSALDSHPSLPLWRRHYALYAGLSKIAKKHGVICDDTDRGTPRSSTSEKWREKTSRGFCGRRVALGLKIGMGVGYRGLGPGRKVLGV